MYSPYMYPVSILSRDAVAQAKERSRSSLDDQAFLMSFGLSAVIEEQEVCTSDAVLLFAGDQRKAFFPRAGVRIFNVDGTDRDPGPTGEPPQMKRFEGPLINLLDQVCDYMPTVIGKSSRLYSLFFREMPEYPSQAWREFIVNAIAHRDYQIQGSESEIWIFEDRIEIESPGRLYDGITIETLEKRSRSHSSRNPRIADVFTACGIMTETGAGIARAKAIMKKSYLNPPSFQETDIGFKVLMQNSPVFDVGDNEWEEKIRKLEINLNQKRILILNRDSSFSNSDYQQINSVDRDTAYREIHELADKNLLRCEGKGRGLKYSPQIP